MQKDKQEQMQLLKIQTTYVLFCFKILKISFIRAKKKPY